MRWERATRGQMLTGICERIGLLITNTRLKIPKRRMYIWKEPGDQNQHQLNYVLVKNSETV
jgi:hypothetical protein